MKKLLLSLICITSFINIKAQSVAVGTGTLVDNYCPIYTYYGFNYSQTIYLASELTSGGATPGASFITSLSYYYDTPSTPESNWNHWVIYMKNSSKSLFASNTDWDNVMTQVFSGIVNIPATGGQWITINLDTPFLWDGTNNLIVGVNEDVPGYSNNPPGAAFQVTSLGASTDYRTLLFYQDPSNPNPLAPPAANYFSNTFANAIFDLTPAAVCSGTPSSGFATSTNTLVCHNTPFDLNLSNSTIALGLSYQWQSSPNGSTWTDIASVQASAHYSISSITDTTYYRCVTTCSASALSSTSTPVVVNLNPLVNCYCMPNYAWDCSGDKFLDFSLANIVNQSNNCDAGGFSDWTSYSFTEVNMNAGSTYTLSVNTSSSAIAGNANVGAWIDYNQNAIFENSEFIYLGYGAGLSYSNTTTVPITAQTGSVRMRLKLDANNMVSSIDACSNNNGSSYGQVLDYKVNIMAAPICSGTPDPGTAISSETTVCQNKAFTLELINNSVSSNINYKWQSSTDNITWTDLAPAQNTIPFSISSQSVSTYYRCVSTCTTSAPTSSASVPVLVNQNLPTACYCTPDFINCANGAIITNVTIASVSYTPACQAGDNYFDITSNPTYSLALTANQTYTISTDISSPFPVGYVGAWIDYNQDGIFDDQNEYISVGNIDNGNLTVPFTVPFTAIGGNTRLRLKMESVNGSFQGLNSCSSHSSEGQTIDYLVNITPLSPCAGTPNAGDATGPSAICENSSFTLNLANNDIVSNMSYQWQSSTDNTNWLDLGANQTFVPYLVNNQSVISYYKCIVTCLTSSLTSSSTTWTVTQNPVTACYCIPEPTDCSSSDVIKYVAFATMTNTSGCDGTNGYSDYTSTVPSATVSAGQSYTLTTVLGYMFGEHTYAWIDYDQNGIFDASEYTDLGPNSGNDTISYTINIPVSATPGTTRMRVRDFTGGILYDGDACISPSGGGDKSILGTGIAYGETEDYLVTILPPDCGNITYPQSISAIGNTNICPGQSTSLFLGSGLPVATGITYQWKVFNGTAYVNEGTASSSPTIIVTPTIDSPYYCEILCNGSTALISDTIMIKINPITISPITTSVTCNASCNGSATLNASSSGGTLTYTWTPLVGSTDFVTGLCATIYTINITNTFGCTITETLSISEPAPILATPSTTNVSCYGLNDGIASISVTGGISPLSYSWSPIGGNGLTASNLTAGTYTFHIQDGNNCSLDQPVIIIQPGVFSASIIGSSASICEQLPDTLKSSITGGSGPYSFNWMALPSNTVSTNSDYTYTTSVGTYSYGLTVTDANNCSVNSNTISITVNPSSNLSGTVTTNTITPVSGRVILYKYLPFYTKFDSVASQNIGSAGDYNFVSFTAGTYIVKAVPSATNMQIAYGDSAVNWKTAKQINHGCAVNDIQNINVKTLPSFAAGPGKLSGIITKALGYDRILFGNTPSNNEFKPTAPGEPIGGIVVKGGRNPGGQMFVQTLTDTTAGSTKGTYTLSGLPLGDYFILVDIPGLDTNTTYHVKITSADTVFKHLDFNVDSIQINPINPTDVGVIETKFAEHKVIVYPNPMTDYLTIQYDLQNNSTVKIELYDVLGKMSMVLLPETKQSSNKYKNTWLLNELKSGLYFLKINIDGSENTIKISVSN